MEYDIIKGDRNLVYEIKPEEQGTSIAITTPADIAERLVLSLSPEKDGRISLLQRTLDWKIGDFIPPTQERWGYGPMLHRITGANNNRVVWECSLPQVADKNPKSYTYMHNTSATLNLLFRVFDLIDRDKPDDQKQLLHVMFEGPIIHAALSARLISFLASFPDKQTHPQIEEIMRKSHAFMTGREDYYRYFSVESRPPSNIYFRCPGISDCSLNPAYNRSTRETVGYRLDPHNVDNIIQQLTFLMGLAQLHQEARTAGY